MPDVIVLSCWYQKRSFCFSLRSNERSSDKLVLTPIRLLTSSPSSNFYSTFSLNVYYLSFLQQHRRAWSKFCLNLGTLLTRRYFSSLRLCKSSSSRFWPYWYLPWTNFFSIWLWSKSSSYSFLWGISEYICSWYIYSL